MLYFANPAHDLITCNLSGIHLFTGAILNLLHCSCIIKRTFQRRLKKCSKTPAGTGPYPVKDLTRSFLHVAGFVVGREGATLSSVFFFVGQAAVLVE